MVQKINVELGKTVFVFKETIYEADSLYYIKSVALNYKDIQIKFILRGREHNPPHIHIYYQIYEFRFKLQIQEFYKNDIETNKGFDKLKSHKIYKAVIRYLKLQQNELTESFYVLNPTLITK